jgi:hypothetical protein
MKKFFIRCAYCIALSFEAFLLGCPTPPASTAYSGSITETSAAKLAKMQAPTLIGCTTAQAKAVREDYEIAVPVGATVTLPVGTIYEIGSSGCKIAQTVLIVKPESNFLSVVITSTPQVIIVNRDGHNDNVIVEDRITLNNQLHGVKK